MTIKKLMDSSIETLPQSTAQDQEQTDHSGRSKQLKKRNAQDGAHGGDQSRSSRQPQIPAHQPGKRSASSFGANRSDPGIGEEMNMGASETDELVREQLRSRDL